MKKILNSTITTNILLIIIIILLINITNFLASIDSNSWNLSSIRSDVSSMEGKIRYR